MENEILNYIPHRRTMALIETIKKKDKENFVIGLEITENSALSTLQGVPTYCGVEYMAQSIAAYNTMFYSEGERAKIGFMVSIRNFKSSKEFFEIGSSLEVHIDPVLIVSNSGTFNCKILSNNNEISSARITAYVPTEEELEKFKRES